MTLSYNVPTTMAYQEESYRFDAGALGHIEGLTVTSNGKPALRYFGGLPYALPPLGPFRFRSPRALPPCYRYGTKANPGRFVGCTSICPQVSSPLILDGRPYTSILTKALAAAVPYTT